MKRRLLLLVMALALFAAACGDSDDSSSEAGDSGDVTTTAAAEAPATTAAPAPTTTAAPAPTTTEDPNADWPDKIVFGFVPSQEQESLQDDIQPFIDVLQDSLGIEVEGIVTTDYTGLVVAMGNG
jgi:phosphonate transport system substrate-binding protein